MIDGLLLNGIIWPRCLFQSPFKLSDEKNHLSATKTHLATTAKSTVFAMAEIQILHYF